MCIENAIVCFVLFCQRQNTRTLSRPLLHTFLSRARFFFLLFSTLRSVSNCMHIHCTHKRLDTVVKRMGKRKRERIRRRTHICRMHALFNAQPNALVPFVWPCVCIHGNDIHASSAACIGNARYSNYSHRLSFRNQLQTNNEASETCFWFVL